MWACRLLAERDSERIVHARDSRAIRGLGDAEELSVFLGFAHRNAVDGAQVAHGAGSNTIRELDEVRGRRMSVSAKVSAAEGTTRLGACHACRGA
jgi:hypothetical protein